MHKYEVSSNLRMVHFVTQLIIESNYFRYIQELGSGKQYDYKESLGNKHYGDGRRFIGRGYFKLVGRTEYEEYKKASGVDVVLYPHYANTPKVAMDIAGFLWKQKNLNMLADQDDLHGVTKLLTGGYIIMREREEVLNRTKQVIGLI